MIFSRLNDDAFWQKVRTEESYRLLRDKLMNMYEENCTCPIPLLSYSDYACFFETGSRKEYEKSYFLRRRRLDTLAVLCKIYPENEAYFQNLEDTVWAILDEYSWALPAHMHHENNYIPETVDLFSAETGYTLSEIKEMFYHRFSPLMLTRISAELDRRIIRSFLATHYAWEDFPENWAAVCGGSVAITFMYENPTAFLCVKHRIDKSMETFLASYKADCICREGLGYWAYGFGYYCYYAAHLREFTNGKEDLFADEKIKTIAKYQQAMFLKKDIAVSFADGAPKIRYPLGLTHFLKKEYGEDITTPSVDYAYLTDTCGRWGAFTFAFLFYDPTYTAQECTESRVYTDSAWYIHRETAYAFAAKGGDNDEPHNHNDLGSFLITDENEQLLADLGAGEYTKQYFEPETRYTILCNSSLGHSVPIIDGMAQKEGIEYTASLAKTEKGISIDLTKAYDNEGIEQISRTFAFSAHEITMTDTFAFSDTKQVTERFVSRIKPEVTENSITIGALTMQVSGMMPVITEDSFSKHVTGEKIPVYLIDFQLEKAHTYTFTITFSI